MYFTIDGPHTRDMDDAIELETNGSSGMIVRVAISDVARVVKPESIDDLAARSRGATRYFAKGNSPMLGSNLADWTLSLVPQRPRRVLVTEMHLDLSGNLTKTTLKFDTIKSEQKLYYDQVPGIIEDIDHPLSTSLVQARSLAHMLLNRRRATGAMVAYDLNNGWVTTEEGSLKKLDSKEETIGYIIIQELMILANAAVALYCIEHNIPVIFRNHEAKAALDRQALMAQITEAMVTPMLDLAQVQHRTHLLLDRAYYKPTLAGHFGLNLTAYLHFTSPIRRYPDLVNHQQIRAHLKGHPLPHTQESLEEISAHLNQLAKEEREKTSEWFKERAEYKARRQIDSRTLDGLIAKEFERALKVELRSSGTPAELPSEAMQEAWIRRLEQNTVPTVCMAHLFTCDRGSDGWDALRAATVEALEERSEDAITVLTQATTLGWNAPTFNVTQSGPAHNPTFEAQGTLVIPDTERVRYFSVHVVCMAFGSAKFVKQRAAVELLRNIANRKEGPSLIVPVTAKLQASKAPPAPKEAPQPPPKKVVAIDLGKPPVSMLMEVSQAEGGSPPEFAFTQTGPSHNPTFRCVARFKHFCVEVTESSKQAAKTAAARELVQKLVG